MDLNDYVVCKFEEHNAVLIRNKFGFWLRRNGEKPGVLIKAVAGCPTKEEAVIEAIKWLRKFDNTSHDSQREM